MGYIVKPIEEALDEHVFEINGAIALKNYTAQVNGNRIKITSNEHSALTLLEADVSEVEIDGQVYTNPVDAQNALQSIVYAELPIVVLTAEEKEKLILKLDKSHPESSYLLRADGTRISAKGLSIKKYHRFTPTLLTGNFSDIYEDYLVENDLELTDDADKNILNDVHFLIENGTDNIVIELDVDGYYNITFSRSGIGTITFLKNGQTVTDNILSGLAKSMVLVKSLDDVKQVSSSIS